MGVPATKNLDSMAPLGPDGSAPKPCHVRRHVGQVEVPSGPMYKPLGADLKKWRHESSDSVSKKNLKINKNLYICCRTEAGAAVRSNGHPRRGGATDRTAARVVAGRPIGRPHDPTVPAVRSVWPTEAERPANGAAARTRDRAAALAIHKFRRLPF